MVFFDDKAATINDLTEAVEAIERELGLTPAGVYASVRTRLDILEARINNPLAPAPNVENPFFIGNDGVTISTGFGAPTENRIPGSLYLREDGYNDQGLYARRPDGYWHQIDTDPWTANRDLAGTIYFQTVVGLQNHDINPDATLLQTDAAGDGYVLTWNATANGGGGWWEPQIGFFAASDLAGTKIAQRVIRIQNFAVSPMAPTDGYALTWNAGLLEWEPQRQAVVFDALDSSVTTNIRSNRYPTQSSIDNTKTGIVNLSSDTSQSTLGAAADYTVILGGDQNQADEDYAAIVGGVNNTNSGVMAFIGGGNGNAISLGGDASIIAGGSNNTLGGANSVIVGGIGNVIDGDENFIGGGNTNNVGGTQNFIGGGGNNIIANTVGQSSILGGSGNDIIGTNTHSLIGGGDNHTLQSSFSTILGGNSQNMLGIYSTILGGYSNLISDGYCFANGISNNILSGAPHSFAHGFTNLIYGAYGSIWGSTNTINASSSYGTIFGDNNTVVSGSNHSTVIGHNNTVGASSSFSMLSGDSNSVLDGYSLVHGFNNTSFSGSPFATMIGSNNQVSGPYGTVFGISGQSNLPGQFTQSARSFTAVGDSQFGRFIVDGYAASGAAFNLSSPINGFNFTGQNNRAYDITVRILVVSTTGAATRARYVYDILAFQTGGTLSIDTSNAALVTDNGTGWTVSFSTSTNQLIITVDSSGTETRRAMATVEWRELSRT